MSQREEEAETQERVVLVVPVQHVKTVKTALERNGQLDRSSKITAETQEIGQTRDTDPVQIETNEMGSNTSDQPSNNPASSSGAPSGSSSTTQFPSLQFDPVTGEYRALKDLQYSSGLVFDEASGQYKQPAAQSQFPSLEFDPDSGEYKRPAASTKFSKLDFDPNAGDYRDSSEIKQTSPLAFNVESGQYEEHQDQPHLDFDPSSGEYKQKSELKFNVESGQYEGHMDQPHLDFDPRSGEYKSKDTQEQRMRIPTTIPYNSASRPEASPDHKSSILDHLGLAHLSQTISLSRSPPIPTTNPPPPKNPLQAALQRALTTIHPTLLTPLNLTPESLLSPFPDSYSIYPPLLLLPHNAFVSPPWRTLFATHSADSDALQPLWEEIAKAVHTTHIAVNSPIPSSTSPTTVQENILRSPVNITPLYGDFGSAPTPQLLSSPTADDFEKAFWVTATQNGIQQTWAPLYTMFSRGNVKEKARILDLAGRSTVHNGLTTAAADLYAGIGYFAFSYRKAGVATVLGWELNAWSVEGLRRGAGMNEWSVRVVTEGKLPAFLRETEAIEEDFLIFQMSNEKAADIVAGLEGKGRLGGGTTHVNLGLLPHSTLAWGTAVRVLDTEREGWIHAHENVAVGDVESRTVEVEKAFQELVDGLGYRVAKRIAEVEHVERVKMYAPGVAHCVFDVRISPTAPK